MFTPPFRGLEMHRLKHLPRRHRDTEARRKSWPRINANGVRIDANWESRDRKAKPNTIARLVATNHNYHGAQPPSAATEESSQVDKFRMIEVTEGKGHRD